MKLQKQQVFDQTPFAGVPLCTSCLDGEWFETGRLIRVA
jgi:hypothetical protein